ncbi:MAG: FAD/NAD(P)-binding protein [Pseudomonadota bacterium]|nr:FAD/NAD(P)-binding protein [Pseudomonadota bacterium]
MIRNVAIIGGGFSGAMLAARLAERGVASTLIDRTGRFGAGLAYSTRLDQHVLNVRSGRMSAIEGHPDAFVGWLETEAPEHTDPEGFAPRRLYGLYVQDRLARVEAAHPGRIERLTGSAVAIDGSTVRLADGRRVEADAVVLATGNPAPKCARGGESGRIIGDPWADGALDRVGPGDDVLIVGSGLTMVDVVLALRAAGWRGRATALSRRGLMPRAHSARHDAPVAPTPALTTGPASRRLAEGRRLAEAHGWRGVMEGLRPVTGELWAAADPGLRARLLRHLRPYWDVHRHRIPASVAATLERLEAEGRLTVLAGRVGAVETRGDGVALSWTPRHGPAQAPLTGGWLIDCSGPGHDPAANSLTGPLVASGRARLDPSGLGLDLDPVGRVRAADGVADPGLFVLGPPARAAFWETIAVPDIRKRIETLAAVLSDPADR